MESSSDDSIFQGSIGINRRFISIGLIFQEIMDFSKNQGLQFLLKILRDFSGAKTVRKRFFSPGRQAPLRKNRSSGGRSSPCGLKVEGLRPPSHPKDGGLRPSEPLKELM